MSTVTHERHNPTIALLPSRLGLDAIIAMSPENFAYVSGAHIITVGMIRARQAFAVIPRQGTPALVVCKIERAHAETESWIKNLTTYIEFEDNPIDMLVQTLKELGLERATVGMDNDYLPLSSYQRLMQLLPELKLVNTTEDLAAVRAIKSPWELDVLEKAEKATHRAVLDAMQASKQGDTEREMSNRIADGILRNGADGLRHLVFASGERTQMAHAMPSDRVPQEGELIRFDVGGSYGVFSSDFARTYSAGNPTQLQRDTYAALCKVHIALIGALRPGMLGEDVFFLSRDEFKKHGLKFHMPHVGHSFGIEAHERPMMRPGEKLPLRAGMAINIEPNVFDELNNFYHVEDLVEVTKEGARVLSLGLAPPELPVIGQPADAKEN
ncbi:MAG TPA: Xaa-Pro peptidase family protein [Terriglobales bacterium]|jgi:Xaa-Pro dipeptidase|nr:Xaa-Pro peptidase family protein [Terriglobales bacterium]